MSYQSLATKYRPKRFQDMVGQDAITVALSNAIRLERIPQGVIFSGVRGIGKTTTARLYAKALNCEQGPTSDPCNDCESCSAINQGIHEDVLEIDGASNTSVDDVRALQETLDYVPQRSPYKIYIIDEVHMLSQSAFNALLKTLEEPPRHVVFAFATTELQKVPETVLSRCQTFHLKRLTLSTIVGRLSEILKQEQVDFEDHALATIAKEGRGSMRDSLTFLDQVIALGGGCVTSESLKGLINTASSKSYISFLQALIKKDAACLMALIEEWDERGIALDDAVEETAKFSRHGFVLKELGTKAIDTNLLGLAPTELDLLLEAAEMADNLELNQIFRTLVKCRKDLDGSELDRFILENYTLEWCLDPGMPSIEELKTTLSGGGGLNVKPTVRPATVPAPSSAPSVQHESKRESSGGKSLKQRWATAFSGEPGAEGSKKAEPKNLDQGIDQNVEPKHSASDSQQKSVTPPSHSDELPEVQVPIPGENVESKVDLVGAMANIQNVAPREQETNSVSKPDQTQGVSTPSSSEPSAPVNESQMPKTRLGTFPSGWRELVEIWKKQKPLQGRILEETVPLEYSESQIKVAVDVTSMAGAKLLNAEHRKRVLDGIRELFDFNGQLIVVERAGGADEVENEPPIAVGTNSSELDLTHEVTLQEASPVGEVEQNSVLENPGFEMPIPEQEVQERVGGESLLEVRQKEEEQARQDLFEELRKHPITEEALSVFDGKISNIGMSDI